MRQFTLHLFAAIIISLLAAGCDKNPKKANNPSPANQPAITAADIEANNQGVGLMAQWRYDKAYDVFAELHKSHPDWVEAHYNMLVARTNQGAGAFAGEIIPLLDELLKKHPDYVPAMYLKGQRHQANGQSREALDILKKVEQADPKDAYNLMLIGLCLESLNQPDEAVAYLKKAITLDPYLTTAFYRLAQLARARRQVAEANDYLAQAERLKTNLLCHFFEDKYTRMGPKASAVIVSATPTPAPVPLPAGPALADPKPLPVDGAEKLQWRPFAAGSIANITACDIDGDGTVDVFIANAFADGAPVRNAVLLRRGDKFLLDPKHPLAAITDINAVLWGDIDNDGLTDAYLCRKGGNGYWKQTKKGMWQNVTAATKTDGGAFNTVDGALVDADHDGDLDILLVRSDGPNELLNNNADGTFKPIGMQTGIAGDGKPSRGVVIGDFDHDLDVDILILKQQSPHQILISDRAWAYHPGKGFDALLNIPIDAAIASDIEADGQTEILAVNSNGAFLFRPDSKGVWSAQKRLLSPPPSGNFGTRMAIVDLYGDGTPNILIGRGNTLSRWHPTITEQAAKDIAIPTAWATIVLDTLKGPAIVGMDSAKAPVILDAGPGRHPFVGLSFTGAHNDEPVDKGNWKRSNASGIGVTGGIRVGSRQTAFQTYRLESGPGQSLQPLCVGLGGAPKIDFLYMIWPDANIQSELALQAVEGSWDFSEGKVVPERRPAGQGYRIEEWSRILTSCPIIFGWNGQKYEFVTDCLGVGGIGFALGNGQYAPSRPWENIIMPARLLKPLNGKLQIKIGEPMAEVTYLDGAALVAYDLPPDWHMTLDERMGVNDPQPTGEPRFYRNLILPKRATDFKGEDVTDLVRSADKDAPYPGKPDSRFISRFETSTFTVEFEKPIAQGTGAPMLLADGWVEYPYSQTMFAAWQAKAEYKAASIEALGADGKWVMLLDQFGYPAGMPRQMSVPLPAGKLPAGCTTLRISTNYEVYWDRLAIAYAEPCPQAKRTVLKLTDAKLAAVGFAKRTSKGGEAPYYDYNNRPPLWDAWNLEGHYTRFGPVDELVTVADDAFAIIGAGEEVHMQFDAPSAGPADGWSRTFVLELVGWCKDTDLYTKTGTTIEPMPAREGATAEQLKKRDELHKKYNTRWRTGW